MLTSEQVKFTQEWWLRLCREPQLMERWLLKLHLTELDGYLDWFGYQAQYDLDPKARATTINIAADELKHANLIENILRDRGLATLPEDSPRSTYWTTLNEAIVDLPTCYAVNYFGEALAAARFEVIASMKETPSMIRSALRIILPDEQFHREALMRLAGPEALEQVRPLHEAAAERLRAPK